jgi:vacuolar-type H+-ATPase subunit E/Vma4
MDTLPMQILSLVVDATVILFAVYFFLRIRSKEKELQQKEGKIDSEYHEIVNTALARERKILDDATNEADKIISEAKYFNRGSTEEVNKALQMMVVDVQREATTAASNFLSDYQASLNQVSVKSLGGFENVVKELESDLRSQVKNFNEALLPGLEKELAEYKRIRMEQVDKSVRRIVQISAQEILNKAISLDDHEELVIAALERAKKEGVFD